MHLSLDDMSDPGDPPPLTDLDDPDEGSQAAPGDEDEDEDKELQVLVVEDEDNDDCEASTLDETIALVAAMGDASMHTPNQVLGIQKA